MRPREGEYWRNKRSGRKCVVKMVRLGAVNYRYLLPEQVGAKTVPLVMKIPAFRVAFQRVDVDADEEGRFDSGSLTEVAATTAGGSTPRRGAGR